MRVQHPAYIFCGHEVGQFIVQRHLHFGPAFAQFRRDERQAESVVDVAFRFAGENAVLAAQSAFIERPAFGLGECAQRGDVLLRAGHRQKRYAVAVFRGDMDRQAVARGDSAVLAFQVRIDGDHHERADELAAAPEFTGGGEHPKVRLGSGDFCAGIADSPGGA